MKKINATVFSIGFFLTKKNLKRNNGSTPRENMQIFEQNRIVRS